MTGHSASESFSGPSLPSGWIAHNGNWSINNSKLEGEGNGSVGFSSLVDHGAGEFGGFEMKVEFTMFSGDHPQGAGVVTNWKDDKNYQIIRYSISESSWNLFTLVDGNRNKQSAATIANTTAPDFGTTVTLRVEQEGSVIRAFDGTTKVLEYTLASADSKSGFVGVFCRGDTVADFDNFTVAP
jgi:hypothetical protein